MIENIIVSIIFGVIIGYFIYRLKRFRDVRNSLKRIQKNNVGRFILDEKKELKGGEEKEDGNNRKAVGLPKPKEGPTNPNNAKQ